MSGFVDYLLTPEEARSTVARPGELTARLRAEVPPRVVPIDPRQASAEALLTYAAGRVEKLPEKPSRELLHSELLLLQKEYMRLLRRSKPSQKPALQRAHESAYERLEALLDDIAPPLTTKPPRTAGNGLHAEAIGIELD